MVAQLSNIAQFCDDLAFVIAGRRSAQNAADVVGRTAQGQERSRLKALLFFVKGLSCKLLTDEQAKEPASKNGILKPSRFASSNRR
jgi:hypothetical protein